MIYKLLNLKSQIHLIYTIKLFNLLADVFIKIKLFQHLEEWEHKCSLFSHTNIFFAFAFRYICHILEAPSLQLFSTILFLISGISRLFDARRGSARCDKNIIKVSGSQRLASPAWWTPWGKYESGMGTITQSTTIW